jgi:hypothetical protein
MHYVTYIQTKRKKKKKTHRFSPKNENHARKGDAGKKTPERKMEPDTGIK